MAYQSTATARRRFGVWMSVFLVWVVISGLVAWYGHMPNTGPAHALTAKNVFWDPGTGLSPPLSNVLIAALFLIGALKLPWSVARGICATLLVLAVAGYTVGNASVVLAHHHQFTGGRWTTLLVVDAVALVLAVGVFVVALMWARAAMSQRSRSRPREHAAS